MTIADTVADSVAPSQRFTRYHPCPICGGYNSMRPGKGIRCAGFISSDEEYAYCQREQFAGDLPVNDNTTPPTYKHKLKGACRCGSSHGLTSPEPCMQAPSRAKKKVAHLLHWHCVEDVMTRRRLPGRSDTA